MSSTAPDLLIVAGPRGLLSLVGIVLIIGGVWYADRKWDEEGSKAYQRAKSGSSYKDTNTASDLTPLIPRDELNAAFPLPVAFLLGWTVFGMSFFFSVDGSSEVVVTWQAIVAALVCLDLGWIASVPMGDAVQSRNATKKNILGLLFVSSWVALTVVSGWGELSTIQAILRVLGAVSIIASMKILWKYRKMGDTWEQEGMPNPNPVVYNVGGPLFVFGWFLFWVGMAATAETTMDDKLLGVPLYFTSRSALAFTTGCGMVPVVMFVDFAHDEGAEWLGFGTDGRFFGRFLESPIPFLVAWTGFGFASFLPFSQGITKLEWIIFGNCVAQGIVAGLLIQTALYKGDLAAKNRWSIPFVLLFLALAIELGYTGGGIRLALSLPGAILIVLGQKTVFGDRKRGDYWMDTGQLNANPIVYSYGEPLFMTGWILMSLVMSIPT